MILKHKCPIIFWSSDLEALTGQAIVSKHIFLNINSNNWIKLIYPSGFKFIYQYLINIIKLYYSIFWKKTKIAYIVPSRSFFGFLRDIPVLLVSYLGVRTIVHIHGDGLNKLFQTKPIGNIACCLYKKTEMIIPCKHLANFHVVPKQTYIIENYSTIPISYKVKKNKTKEVRILWNSNIMATKGIDIVIDGLKYALKYKINLKLTILGKTLSDTMMDRQEIESYSNKLKQISWINYLGSVSPHKIPHLTIQHDIAVLLSVNECQPMAIIEAMCCGLKLIVSDIPGIRNTVGKYPAYFVKRNKISFAKAFVMASNDAPVDHFFRKYAIKRFCKNRFTSEMEDVLNKIKV